VEKIDWVGATNRLVLWQWLIAAVSVASGLGIWVVFGKSLPTQVPVFHSLPWGEEQLAAPVMLFIPLGISFLIALFTSSIAVKRINEKVLAAIISGTGLVSEVILVLSVLRTILLVT
jgi:hypothetical protein